MSSASSRRSTLDDRGRALARRLADGRPLALALTKGALERSSTIDLDDALEGEAKLQGIAGASPTTPRGWPPSARSARRGSPVPDDRPRVGGVGWPAMTDPLALDPVLSPTERSSGGAARRAHDEAYEAWFERFEAHVMNGGKVEAVDAMPDEYRTAVLRFVEMHANSELMGVLPEREWLMRAPTLRRKLALTAKVQDEVGHAQLLYRVAEDLGKPREAMFDDLLAGKTKFHNVFHYPTVGWADVGMIAWLVDAAAIVAQQALRDSSYAPYARTMRKICWEESVHIMHGRDVVVTMVTGTPAQRAASRTRSTAGGDR